MDLRAVLCTRTWSVMAESREVLCDFEGRRRPLFFYSSKSAKEAHGNLLSAAKATFADVLSCKEDDSYFLQVDTKKHGMIDVVGCSEPVDEGQTVFLRYWKSPENDVSFVPFVSDCVYSLLL